jgi:signal transduction histidine kinase
MTDNPQVKGRSLKDTLLLVGSSEAFTKRVFLWTLPIGLFVAVFYDGLRFGTSRLGWLAIGLVAHVIATLVMFLLRHVMLPRGQYDLAAVRTMLIFVIGSSVRSMIIGVASFELDLAPSPLLGYRIFAGALIGALALSVLTVIAAVAKEHAQTQELLNNERLALESAEQNAQDAIEHQRLEIKGILQESVEPALVAISQNLRDTTIHESTTLSNSADKISEFIEVKLRPLTASLHKRQIVDVPEVSLSRDRPSLVSIPKFVTLREVTSPLAIFLVLVAPYTTGLYPYRGYAALPLIIVMISPMSLIQIGFLSLPFARKPLPGRFAFSILIVLFATSWLPAVFIAELLNIDIIERFNLIPTLTIGTTLVGMLITYGFTIDQERIRYESELFAANQALELELNRTAQQIWLLRQQAAQILHGSVQSSLTAANMRIRGATQIDGALLSKVQEDVERASYAIANYGASEISLEKSLTEIADLWQGVCDVKFQYSNALMESVSKDSITAHCINEIVKECVSNAIRHGNAKRVSVEISDPKDGSLVISVTNDGGVDISTHRGVGSEMLDEISMNWSRERTDIGVRVLAKVAAR